MKQKLFILLKKGIDAEIYISGEHNIKEVKEGISPVEWARPTLPDRLDAKVGHAHPTELPARAGYAQPQLFKMMPMGTQMCYY